MAYTTINKSTDYFNTKLYTGNGNSSHAQTGVGFQPDFTWLKARSESEYHFLYDAVRGATKGISSDLSATEATYSDGLTAFASDGFTLGSSNGINRSGTTYTSWNWKANGQGSANTDGSINSTVSANTTAGFSIVKYTGNGTNNASVGHGLGVAPKIIFFKNLNGTNNWRVQYSLVDGSRDRLQLNTNVAKYDSASVTANSNSLFYLDTGGEQNASGDNFIAYCFADVTGYSKFGSYVGNGSTDGTFVYTGFKPAFYLWKRTNGTSDWHIVDNKRDTGNETDVNLFPNSNSAESIGNGYNGVDFLSNGIKARQSNTDVNGSGSTYIYMAFGQSLVGSNNIPCTAF